MGISRNYSKSILLLSSVLSEVNIGVDEKIIGSKEVGLLVIADPKFQKFIEDHPGDLNLCFELFKSNNISSVIDITSIIGTTINKEFWRFRLKSNTFLIYHTRQIVDANDKTFQASLQKNNER